VGWLTGLSAVAAAVAVVVAAVSAFSGGDGDRPDVGEVAAEAAEDAGSTVVELAGAEGAPVARVVISEGGEGYVLFDELPELGQGRTYQLWKLDDSATPISLGVVGDGSAEAVAVAIPPGASSFALSDEPGEGTPAPTGPVVASGDAA
jgi:anti-sigma-K factor RskA